MKIVLNSLADVRDFLSLMTPTSLRMLAGAEIDARPAWGHAAAADSVSEPFPDAPEVVGEAGRGHVAALGYGEKPDPTPADAGNWPTSRAETVVAAGDANQGPETGAVGVELDASGRPWDEEIDSAAQTKTKAGVWTRSKRRDLTNERYAERLAELIAKHAGGGESPAVPATTAEPVATERHALPTDGDAPDDGSPKPPSARGLAPVVDFSGLVDASEELAGELPGSMGDLMVATRDFIAKYGVQAMNELRVFLVPDPNNPDVGLSVGALKPGQRSLVQACIQLYPEYIQDA